MPSTTVLIGKIGDRDYREKYSFQSAKIYEENTASRQCAVVLLEALGPVSRPSRLRVIGIGNEAGGKTDPLGEKLAVGSCMFLSYPLAR